MIRSILSATLVAEFFACGATLRGDEPVARAPSPVAPAPHQAAVPAPAQAVAPMPEQTVAPAVIEQPVGDMTVIPVRRYGYWGGHGYGYPGYYRYPGYRWNGYNGYGYYPRYYYSVPPYYVPAPYRYYYGGPYGGFQYYGPRGGVGIVF